MVGSKYTFVVGSCALLLATFFKSSFALKCYACQPKLEGNVAAQATITVARNMISLGLTGKTVLECPAGDFNTTAEAYQLDCPVGGDDAVCAAITNGKWTGRGCLASSDDEVDECHNKLGFRLCICKTDKCNENGAGSIAPTVAILMISAAISMMLSM